MPLSKIIANHFYIVDCAVYFSKTVYFFLMTQNGGSIENHDEEFDEVVWMSIQNAKEKLTYKDEFSILEKAFHAKYKK